MKQLLPLFPLQLVAFPGELLNLHVFEPRYKQLIEECAKEQKTFGIPAFINGNIRDYGTEMELLKIEERYPDGKMDIRTRGKGLFRVEEFYSRAPEKLYAAAQVERLEYTSKADTIVKERLIGRINDLFGIMQINKEIPPIGDFNSFVMAHHVGLSIQQEYELLCIRSEHQRLEFMLAHLERFIPIVREMENLRKRVQMNGHFKDVIPPQF